LSSVLGNGVLASGGDTRFILLGNLAGTYLIGLPAAVGLGLFTGLGFFGVFTGKVFEEGVKATCFLLRFLKYPWYEHALQDERIAKDEAERGEDRENEPPESVAI
jgi:Na+-driven multidrug efflux pump